ncbi:cytochrome c5 [Methylovorus glucosotrophus]|jgi:cytochrome c5|uniref:c-type cytochrome n=1 Tax=Methylovorus glucosotrophus TaxID=266009 RepID=UPI0013319BE6|nr:c-type cytochrome [Methylovorus glucosotrophus]KAF0843246.1 cytochrome c5 [Methylovorus glucosotrophus]
MGEHHHEFPKTTVTQVVLATLGGLFAPALVIFLIVKMLFGIQASHLVDADPAIQQAVVEERIKPVAQVEVADNSGPHVDKTGEQVVTAVCSACHAAGALGSPKIGDKAAWGPRIAQGYETLIKHAIEGIRSMPARGGNPDLTDNEVANAVAYMANQAGASFKSPELGGASHGGAAPAAAAEAAPAAAPAAAPVAAAPAPAPAAQAKAAAPAAPAAAPAEEAKPAVVAEAPKPAASGKSGEEVVKGVCAMCHAGGLMGAPKIGDKDGWAPRIAQGYDTLVQHAIHGIRMMPAKGGNPGLSDAEVARAVAYMANQGGANFKAD